MNPLPTRTSQHNSSAPLSLPNVPSFEQIAYNGRPRKVLPETGKEFPLLNGLHSGPIATPPPLPASGSAGTQLAIMERNHGSSGIGQQSSLPPITSQAPTQSHPPSSNSTDQLEKEREVESDSRQVTAIFRPDEAGEWKERLRVSHEVAEKSRLSQELQQVATADLVPWDSRDEEEPKEEEADVEDEEGSLVGDGEHTKLWKPKRTLRKLVSS